MSIGTGQPLWRQDDHSIERATPGRVTQTVQGRAIQPCAADPSIAIFMLWPQRPPLVLNMLLAREPLTLDRAFLLLMIGRDSRLEGYLHTCPPGVPQ